MHKKQQQQKTIMRNMLLIVVVAAQSCTVLTVFHEDVYEPRQELPIY